MTPGAFAPEVFRCGKHGGYFGNPILTIYVNIRFSALFSIGNRESCDHIETFSYLIINFFFHVHFFLLAPIKLLILLIS